MLSLGMFSLCSFLFSPFPRVCVFVSPCVHFLGCESGAGAEPVHLLHLLLITHLCQIKQSSHLSTLLYLKPAESSTHRQIVRYPPVIFCLASCHLLFLVKCTSAHSAPSLFSSLGSAARLTCSVCLPRLHSSSFCPVITALLQFPVSPPVLALLLCGSQPFPTQPPQEPEPRCQHYLDFTNKPPCAVGNSTLPLCVCVCVWGPAFLCSNTMSPETYYLYFL